MKLINIYLNYKLLLLFINKEANYISIASIFLSMFSVMTKSLVFSQGIDIKTYILSMAQENVQYAVSC